MSLAGGHSLATDAPRTTSLGACLVTGAAGYLGRHLARELVRRGCDVRGFDRAPLPEPRTGIDARMGDVTRPADVRAACEGVDTVFHTAAVLDFLRFPTPAERRLSEAVNVGGTENVLRAAQEAGARRLVYTSTNNVAFDGRPVEGGDETSPTAERARDVYTATKLRAEKRVLAANGEAGLLTCAIRPGGIFGPGEERFLPVLVEQCARGRFRIVIGDGRALADTTFIDNLVDGHIAAALHLAPGSALGGQAYFITDGAPLNTFEFFRPLILGMGFPFPRWHVPVAPLYAVAWLWEWLHGALRLPPPPLTCLELRKVATTHTFRIDKARRDFGWEPRVQRDEVWARCLAYCQELLARRAPPA